MQKTVLEEKGGSEERKKKERKRRGMRIITGEETANHSHIQFISQIPNKKL